jgi:large subunit ribosomal protein L22
MEATATLRYFKMSAQKVRLVADLIRGQGLEKAINCLDFLQKRAAKPIATLLRSAAANAGNKDGMNTKSLLVSKICVDEGPMAKRFMPRAQGRSSQILKKSCHISVVLGEG